MTKFWNICFKISQILLAIGMVIIILVGLYYGGCALFYTFKPVDKTISYTGYYTFNNDSQKVVTEVTENDTEQFSKIKGIVEELGFPKNCYNAIVSKMNEIEPQDREDFINNMKNFYGQTYLNYIDTTKASEPYFSEKEIVYYMKIYNIYESKIIPTYFDNYKKQKDNIAILEQQNALIRNISAGAFGICVVLFILMMIIPLLIKIEENTRK